MVVMVEEVVSFMDEMIFNDIDVGVQMATHNHKSTIDIVDELGIIIANGGLDLIVGDHETICDVINVSLRQFFAGDIAVIGHQQ